MLYRIKATEQSGSITTIDVDAAGIAQAREQARRQGYRVLSVVPTLTIGGGRWKRVGGFSLLSFSQELLALLDAGLGLIEALGALARKERQTATRAMLDEILSTLRRGEPLSSALSRFPGQFPPIYVAAIQASERTSNLKEAITRYIAYAEQYDPAKNKIVSALIYPAIVLIVGALVIAFLFLYVIPRFSRVYEGFHGEIPFFSVVLLAIGQTVDRYSMLFAGIAFLGLAVGVWAMKNEAIRQRLGATLLRLSWFREKVQLLIFGRLYRTLGMLLRGGIPILAAGAMVEPLLPLVERSQLRRSLDLIREGHSISESMEAAGLATPVGLSLLVVGERSGQMGEAMERIAAFHDEEVTRWTEHFVRLFEPIIMAALGLVVGSIVVMMYMPIFELAGVVQ